MRKVLSIIFAFLPVFVLAMAFDLVSESPEQLLIKFELPQYEILESMVGGQKTHSILCEEGSYTAKEAEPNTMVFSVPIAIPIDGEISFSILSSKTKELSNINLEATPSRFLAEDGTPYYENIRDYRIYSKSGYYPSEIVEVGESAFIGDRRFVSLRVYPFRYAAMAKKMMVYEEINLVVNIGGSKKSAANWQNSENPIDLVADSFFINNQSSKSWRLEKKKDYNYSAPKGSLNAIDEIQILVDSEGIYKVSYEQLKTLIVSKTAELGMEMSWDIDEIDPRNLELSDQFGQIPLNFVGENDGSFDPGDYFEFFGDLNHGNEGFYGEYTSENVYTLRLVSGFGARMAVENGGLVNSNPGQYIKPVAYEAEVHFEKQLMYEKLGQGWTPATPNFYREDNWFWEKIQAPNLKTVPIELQYPSDNFLHKASAKVSLYGLTFYGQGLAQGQYDHEATVRINQAMINSHYWKGQTEKLFINDNQIPNSFLNHGTNNLYISLSGNTMSTDKEQVLLDYVQLKYWRLYKTDEDFIKFTKPSDKRNGLFQFEVEGFSSPNISVYKIGSSVFNNLQIEPFNITGGAPWTVSLQDSVMSQAVRYYAVEEGQKKKPKAMRLNVPSDLKNPLNAANVLIITPYQFTESEATLDLKELWEGEGHTVKIVDTQDIYDEFNHGIFGADPIKDFLYYAYNNWSSPQLSYVILLGEGVYDSRDNSPSRRFNLIPVRKMWTGKHGATASDTWYGCIVGDDSIPDIVIARINAWEEQQIADFAAKAHSYREEPQTNRLWNSHITFAAGGKIDDGHDKFSQQSERIRAVKVPKHYRVKRVYTSTQTVSNDYFGGTFDLKDAINSGTQFVQFMGHGGGQVWADYNLFNRNDVLTLNNRTYPVFLSLSCYGSAFDTNGALSISESVVLQPNKGAIAALGFAGLGYLYQDEDWGMAFAEAAFVHDFPTLGDAYLYALARFFTTTSAAEARYALTNGSAYLGDPLIRFRKPITGQEVSLSSQQHSPGDILNVQASFPSEVQKARLFVMNKNEKIINVPYDIPVVSGSFNANYNIPTNSNNTLNKVLVAGYSAEDEYLGLSSFGVGRPNIMHQGFVPAMPSFADSISFVAKAFSSSEIESLVCKVRVDSLVQNNQLIVNWVDLPMAKSLSDGDIWQTVEKLAKQRSGKRLYFKYQMRDENQRIYESYLQEFDVAGPDLILKDIKFVVENGVPKLKVKSGNIGNVDAPATDLRTYYRLGLASPVLFANQVFAALGVNEERWDEIPLTGAPNGTLRFEVQVNPGNTFSELHFYINTNNFISITVPMNYHTVPSGGGVVSSVDGNLLCAIPSGFADEDFLVSLNRLTEELPHTQPDLHGILLQNSDSSVPYRLSFYDSTLVDSLGFFEAGKRVQLSFQYHNTDADTQAYETDGTYQIYRFNETYQKWALVGGIVSPTANEVNFEVEREGIYTIFRNMDKKVPVIDVNVEEQEFTVGGYVASDGVVSILLSDANGIDVIDDTIRMYLNGTVVPQDDYVISINRENINEVPIKYQLDLKPGQHELKIDCKDLNGNFVTRMVKFTVNNKFDIIKIGNYPNPVVGQAQDPRNDGRTRFTYVLTDTADEVYIKIYTISGRLVKTFKHLPTGVGYHEYPRSINGWDCKDEQGFTLANGVYFYKVVARKGAKKIEKTMKMAILR